jgi:hypothetical protein
MKIKVAKPFKDETAYVFDIEAALPDGSTKAGVIGFKDANFAVPHAQIWDSFYPLMHITRNGGPLYKTEHKRAEVHFEFAASRQVVAHFQKRARQFGLELDVTSSLADVGYEAKSAGSVLLFGGGKDSRLLLGMLRETGHDPAVLCAWGSTYAADLPNVLSVTPISSSMPSRIVPGLMLLPRTIYHGSGLGEVHLSPRGEPWHQYFDISSPVALAETSALFKSIGLEIAFEVPLCVLPYNLTQKILAFRYPELYARQVSVRKNERTEKALHLALLKLYHGLSFDDCCDGDCFLELLHNFAREQLAAAEGDWGYRGHREIISREMRAIIRRLQERGAIQLQQMTAPSSWDEPWIDSIHHYANPAVPEEYLAIYREYAESFDPNEAPSLPESLRRIWAERTARPDAAPSPKLAPNCRRSW